MFFFKIIVSWLLSCMTRERERGKILFNSMHSRSPYDVIAICIVIMTPFKHERSECRRLCTSSTPTRWKLSSRTNDSHLLLRLRELLVHIECSHLNCCHLMWKISFGWIFIFYRAFFNFFLCNYQQLKWLNITFYCRNENFSFSLTQFFIKKLSSILISVLPAICSPLKVVKKENLVVTWKSSNSAFVKHFLSSNSLYWSDRG